MTKTMDFLKRLGMRVVSWLSLVAFVVITGLIVNWWIERQRANHQAEVAAAAIEFAPFLGVKSPPSDAVEDANARYRKGYLLLINAEDSKVDELFYDLPRSLHASRASEVNTLAWMNWNRQTIGYYGRNGAAMKTDCDVTVYDVARKVIVAREHFEGEQPPSSSKSSWDHPPNDKIVDFLRGLPEH